MIQDLTYRKTASGTQAIATRQAGLGPRERALLIMVDGRRSVAELNALGNAGELLRTLLEKGFIEPLGGQLTGWEATQPAPLEGVPARRPHR